VARVRLLAARDVAVVGVALLCVPAAADAASVQATDDQCAAAPCVSELMFTAGAGEGDDVTIAYDGDGVVVRDPGVPLEPGRSCAARDDGSVRCALSRPIVQFVVDTGDGDDVVRATLPGASHLGVNLGPGNDRFDGGGSEVLWVDGWDGDEIAGSGLRESILRGLNGDDALRGGAGDDELEGGPGRDRLDGGAGDDVLHGSDTQPAALVIDRPARDRLDGGRGRDRVTYQLREGPRWSSTSPTRRRTAARARTTS
jgi:Ca2+-binding RTX toxin-like protein